MSGEELTPYDLTAGPKAHVLLTPGWDERLRELTPRILALSGMSWAAGRAAKIKQDEHLYGARLVGHAMELARTTPFSYDYWLSALIAAGPAFTPLLHWAEAMLRTMPSLLSLAERRVRVSAMHRDYRRRQLARRRRRR